MTHWRGLDILRKRSLKHYGAWAASCAEYDRFEALASALWLLAERAEGNTRSCWLVPQDCATGRRLASSSKQACIFPASGHQADQTIPGQCSQYPMRGYFLSFRSKKHLTRSAQLSKDQGISSEEFDRAVFFCKDLEEI